MMIRMHPAPDLLVEYAAGALAPAPCISVTAHLQFCEHCHDAVSSMKEIGADLMTSGETIPVSDDLLDRVLACIDADQAPAGTSREVRTGCPTDEVTGSLPAYIQGLLPGDGLHWRKQTASVRVAAISVGENRHELALHRINAGGKAPQHDHRGREITVVLKGSFSDEDGVYQPGDFIVREPGDVHRPYAARNEECICLSVLEAPIRLTGMKRVLNPFIGFSPS